MLATFRVALHYIRPDNHHVFMSCDVVELGLSSVELDSRLVEICRDSFVLLRAYSLLIESTPLLHITLLTSYRPQKCLFHTFYKLSNTDI